MNINLILTVTALHFLALITPGPDFVLTIRNALQFGRAMGFATAIGFGLGIALHVTYSIAGVAILIKEFPEAFQVVKILGALYIIWLGISTLWGLRIKKETHDVTGNKSASPQPLLKGLRQGFLTNILNPKATLFILGLFTSVIPVETELLTLLVSGLIMTTTTVLWFSLVSTLFGSQKVRLLYLKAERGLNFIFAIFFLMAGSFLLLK